MQNRKKTVQKYCTGCGMCSVIGNEMVTSASGFCEAAVKKEYMSFYNQICPVFDKSDSEIQIWGNVEKAFLGWACDKKLRHKASSGGTLSALSMYLLDNNIVDGIIHCCVDDKVPYKTVTVCSTCKDDIYRRSGSRYSQSSPLYDILNIIEDNKKYAFIGKPCDIYSLKKYAEMNEYVRNHIIYYLSFFCAGTPSIKANEKLIYQLSGNLECKSLTYRGNGWPGETIVVDNNGIVHSMSYENSWGGILGRDVRKICRMCNDGIGLYADVVCCDAWYLNMSGTPDFSNHDGRNAIFARNNNGIDLLAKASEAGYVHCEEYPDYYDELSKVQNYQFTRRATMLDKVIALRFLLRRAPEYSLKNMKKLASNVDNKTREKIFIGTMKRILKGKM